MMSLAFERSTTSSDENIKNMQMNDWKSFVKSVIYREAFMELQIECSCNKKTSHIS